MENKSAYLQLRPSTLEHIRKDYNLDKPGAMDQAIDMLRHWTQKQTHFMKKDFPRNYLEGFIVTSKGSVEKAKVKIDKLCTIRTMVPSFSEKCHAKHDFPKLRDFFISFLMPEMCDDYSRIFIGRLMSKNISPAACLETYQHGSIICEYGMLNDYAKGYYVVFDLGDINIKDLITNIDLNDLRHALFALLEAYGIRVRKIYLISSSLLINALVKVLKQFVSAKISKRIMVLQTAESLQEHLPKQYLPKEYGGDQKSVLDLYDEFNEELCSERHVAHMQEMRQAYTNEALRCSDRFNEEFLGMPGSFKMLSID